MRQLGYLPGELSEWDAELLLDYMRRVSWWLHAEEPLRLAPEDLWRSTEWLREEDAHSHVAQLRRMTLPPEALLLRRMEGLLFQTAATLRASAPWGTLLRELIEGAAPSESSAPSTQTGWPATPAYGRTVPRWAWSAPLRKCLTAPTASEDSGHDPGSPAERSVGAAVRRDRRHRHRPRA